MPAQNYYVRAWGVCLLADRDILTPEVTRTLSPSFPGSLSPPSNLFFCFVLSANYSRNIHSSSSRLYIEGIGI